MKDLLIQRDAFLLDMHHVFKVDTFGKGTYNITSEVESFVRSCLVKSGQCCVFIRHTSCSLVLMEDGDPKSRSDLLAFFDKLVPDSTPYFEHTDEGSDDMPSHIKMVLTNPSTTIPIIDGELMLGTWQSLYLFEHRRAAHTRSIIVSVIS